MNSGNAPKGWHSRGYLPHFDSPERIQHVIFRTAGSLPKEALAALREACPREYDTYLDDSKDGTQLADRPSARSSKTPSAISTARDIVSSLGA